MTSREFVLSIFLIIGLTAPVQADFEDGIAALGRGDYETAQAEFLALAKQGNRDAQFALGQMYQFGTGFPQDDAAAFDWYREAAELGHPGAQSILGFMHAYGVGSQQNILEGYVWFSLAAAQGNPIAEDNRNKLAHLMTAQQRTEAEMQAANRQREVNAAIARLQSASKAVGPAESKAAEAEAPDIPVEPASETDTTAQAEFLALAKQGNRDAQFALGQMYQFGTGFPQDDAAAFDWYREAAELGHPGAQSILGFMHAYGVGSQQNILEGYVWFSLAAAQGNPIAEDNRNKLAHLMTAQQRTEAEMQAANRQREVNAAIARLQSASKAVGPAESKAAEAEAPDIPIEPASETDTGAPLEPQAFRVQLGAFRVPENAPAAWQELQRTYPDLLKGLQPEISRVDRGTKGALHFLRVGPLASAQSAAALCTSLNEHGVDCLVVRP